MDESKVLLVNLAKGRIGEDSSSLLGGLLVTTIGLAAFSRSDIPPSTRRDFFVYIDEFQNFMTLALANMLSEMRKYRVGFTVAHQYLNQLEPEIRHAVFGNSGSIISFRIGGEDAPYLARGFQDRFEEIDLMRLENYHVYLKLMIDGMPSKPFSARTLNTEKPWHRRYLTTLNVSRQFLNAVTLGTGERVERSQNESYFAEPRYSTRRAVILSSLSVMKYSNRAGLALKSPVITVSRTHSPSCSLDPRMSV